MKANVQKQKLFTLILTKEIIWWNINTNSESKFEQICRCQGNFSVKSIQNPKFWEAVLLYKACEAALCTKSYRQNEYLSSKER